MNVIGAVLATGDDLIVAGALGTTALGLYSIAYRIPDLLIKNMSNVAGQVLFPAMTTLDRGSLPAGLLRSLRYAAMVALPLAVGVGVLAEPLVLVLFGDQWRGAITAMQVMALWTVMTPIDMTIGTAYKSIGRADLLLKLAIPRLLILLPSIALVADHGIVAVAWCQAAVAIGSTWVGMLIATRILDLTGRQIWSAVWPPALAAACLGGVLLPLENAISSPVAALAISFVVAVRPTWACSGYLREMR